MCRSRPNTCHPRNSSSSNNLQDLLDNLLLGSFKWHLHQGATLRLPQAALHRLQAVFPSKDTPWDNNTPRLGHLLTRRQANRPSNLNHLSSRPHLRLLLGLFWRLHTALGFRVSQLMLRRPCHNNQQQDLKVRRPLVAAMCRQQYRLESAAPCVLESLDNRSWLKLTP